MVTEIILFFIFTVCRACHARQVKGDDPDKKGYPGPPGWGLGVGLRTPSHKKCFVEKLLKFETGQQFWKRLKSTKDCNATRRRRLFVNY
jgi:hypothetical protein